MCVSECVFLARDDGALPCVSLWRANVRLLSLLSNKHLVKSVTLTGR